MDLNTSQIMTALIALFSIPLGGISVEHFLENFVTAHIPSKQVKTLLPYVFSWLGQAVVQMSQGVPPMAALLGGHSVVATFFMGVFAQIVHKTPVGATPVAAAPALPPMAKKVGAFLLVALLGLGAGLHADGTELIATINPSASGTMFLVDHQGNLIKNNASLYGADLVVGLVSVSGTVASPSLFAGLGTGMVQDADLNSTRIYGKVMVGYWLFNAFAAYDGINTRIGAGVTAPITLLTGTYKVLKTNF